MISPAPARHYRIALAILLLMVLGMFWQWVFTSRVPFMRDVSGEHFPRTFELRTLVRSGSLPLWNNFEYCGEPVATNPIYLLFYPTSWLAWILPVTYGFKLHYVLHFLWLAAGGFFLAKRSGLSPFSCWLAGVLWVFSGPVMSLGNFYNMLPAASWMPWLILAADYRMRTEGWRATAVLAVAMTAQVLTAELASVVGSLTLAFGWCLAVHGDWKSLLRSDVNRRLIGRYFGAGLVAIGLASAQIFPVLATFTGTPRTHLSYYHATFWSLHPLKLLEILVPEMWGNWLTYGSLPWIYMDSREPFLLSLHLGIIPIALAMVAALCLRTRIVRFWAVAGVCFLLVAMGRFTPLADLFYYVIPIFRISRFPVKLILPAVLAATQLAATGVEYLLSGRPDAAGDENDRRATTRLLWLGRGLMAFGILWLAAAFAMFSEPVKYMLERWVRAFFGVFETSRLLMLLEMARPEIVARATNWIPVVIARRSLFVWFSVLLLILVLYRRGRTPTRWSSLLPVRPLTLLAVAASVATLVFTHAGINPVVDRRFFDDVPPVARYLTGTPPIRIFAEPTFRLANSLLSLAVEPNPVAFLPPPAQVLYCYRMALSIDASTLGFEGSYLNDPEALLPEPVAQLNFVIYDQHLSGAPLTRILQLSSVEYATFTVPVPGPWMEPLGVAPNGNSRGVTAYRVTDPVPRAYLAEEASILPYGHDAIIEMIANDFDPRRQVVLQPDASRGPGSKVYLGKDPSRSATLLRREAMRVDVETNSRAPSFLVLTDRYDPHWQATVDGQPAQILLANQIFRAVELPAGTHKVVFRYVPIPLYMGLAVSLLTALFAAVMAARDRGQETRPAPNSNPGPE